MADNELEAAETAVQQKAEARKADERAQLIDRERRAALEARMRKATRGRRAQAQKHTDAILERTTARYVRLGTVEETLISTSLDPSTQRVQVDDYLDGGECVFNFPEDGLDLLRQAFGTVPHPRDLEGFRAEGEVYCSRHGEDHRVVLAFKGLELAEVNIDACTCVEGDPHRYQNAGGSLLNFATWKIPPGEVFDCPDGGEETLASFLKAGYVKDREAPEEPAEEVPETTEEDLLDAAVTSWEEILESRRREAD